MTPEQIGKIKDPERRAVEAMGFIRRGESAIGDVRQVRDAAVVELRKAGWSQRRIAALLGVTPAAAHKMEHGR